MKSRSVLQIPTKKLVNHYLQSYENEAYYRDGDKALEKVIKKFPYHHKVEEVLIKVCLINDLYSTSVFNTYQMAIHIKEQYLASVITKGEPEAVNKIATGHGIGSAKGKERHFYSFATKYCNWHNQSEYPILDSFVEKMLILYRNQDGFSEFKNRELRDYNRFKSIMEDFRSFYELKGFDLKQLDKFLWGYGKVLLVETSKVKPDGQH